ncbi:phage head closure protein [Clostridium butyricum]|uniref:phage head closure protein n=1 Tax=Clostridium butyricum TaxID=1492 RepID=UPI00374EA2BD
MIGELKHRITFEKLITVVNENGFETEEWKEYKVVWAKVSNLSGREYFQAATINKEKIVKFLVRFFENITEDMRIRFDERQYDIVAIDNIKYENKYLEIKGIEIEE